MHITLTGSRGSGKSTLAQRVISDLDLQPSGFLTLSYTIAGQRRGHYLHSLVDCPDQLNDLPISALQAPGLSVGIPDTFATLGVTCLNQSLTASSDCILLDEIGRFETACRALSHGGPGSLGPAGQARPDGDKERTGAVSYGIASVA